ncbi:MAG: hypothetical protein R3F11_24485 [Verrucomicrobiales bacterium]
MALKTLGMALNTLGLTLNTHRLALKTHGLALNTHGIATMGTRRCLASFRNPKGEIYQPGNALGSTTKNNPSPEGQDYGCDAPSGLDGWMTHTQGVATGWYAPRRWR